MAVGGRLDKQAWEGVHLEDAWGQPVHLASVQKGLCEDLHRTTSCRTVDVMKVETSYLVVDHTHCLEDFLRDLSVVHWGDLQVAQVLAGVPSAVLLVALPVLYSWCYVLEE